MTPDINILIAASRTDHVHHKPALDWLKGAIADCTTGGTLQILPMVAAGFLRLATNPRVFLHPTPSADAVAFIDALLNIPGVDMPELGREWPTLRQLCCDGELTANEIPDAWIAASVRTLGGHLVTFDRDFNRLLARNELTVLAG
jgi:toxin-antitoxin system PIN domain toxin